ncbi:MAG: anthrone oxygenase family protein [Pseudomonadota bacterium]
MLDSVIALSLNIATLGAGLMAGVYFGFSVFVMHSLDRLGAVQAADAMNSINRDILKSWFMPVFFGSTLLYAALSGIAIFNSDLPGRWLLVAIGLLYVSGMFLCTAIFNVPLNNRLAESTDDENTKSQTWTHYYLYWTRWNHLRSVCSLVTMVLSIQYLAEFG